MFFSLSFNASILASCSLTVYCSWPSRSRSSPTCLSSSCTVWCWIPLRTTARIKELREFKLHAYVKRQTRNCTTWPSFPLTCRLLSIISTHKSVFSSNFFIYNNCFEPFLSAHFLFWEIFNLNLTLFVYVKLLWSLTLFSLSSELSQARGVSRRRDAWRGKVPIARVSRSTPAPRLPSLIW